MSVLFHEIILMVCVVNGAADPEDAHEMLWNQLANRMSVVMYRAWMGREGQ